MPFRRCFLAIVFVLSLMSYADACPGCRNVNEKDKHLPMAYQTSILFMLSVPMSLIGGIVFGLYRLNQVQEAAVNAFESGDVWHGTPEAPPGQS